MPERIRTIVVGAGRGRAHLRSLLALPTLFEVVGLVDLDADRLTPVLAANGLPAHLGFTSYDEALTRTNCDAVVIATWARTHAGLVEQALRAGKHVMVEKPFVLNLEAGQHLLELAAAQDRKIAVTQQWRYMPGQRTVRRLMSAQTYGQPQTGHLHTYKARGGEYPDSEHAQLWQMTVHEVDSLIAMMNQPIVEVYGHSYRPPATTWKRESTATAELKFRNGCHMVLVSTSDSRVWATEFRVECEHAALVHRSKALSPPEELYVGHDRELGLQPLPIDPGPEISLDQQVAAGFAAWVQGGPEPETSGRNNLQVVGVLDALIRSGESAAAVPVSL